MRIHPEQLITFSVVAEYSSVSKAAEVLNLSQPAISGQLRSLQDTVGQALYLRRARGIVLTPAGEQLLPYAHAVARNVQQVEEQIHDLQNRPAAPLRVGFSYALSPQVAPLTLQAEEAGLKLVFSANTSANLVRQVHGGELDAALVLSPIALPQGQLDTHTIGGDELRLITPCHHRLAGQGYVPLTSLQGETLLWAGLGSTVRKQADRLLEGAGVAVRRTLELGSLDAVRAALLSGHGIAILPAGFVRYEVESGLLCSAGLEALHTTVTHLLVTAPHKVLGPEMRQFVQLLSRRASPA